MVAFATSTELATFIGSPDIDISRADLMLNQASAIIRREADGQTLSTVIGTIETFSPSDSLTLLLSQRPVTAITQVVVDGVALASEDFLASEVGAVRLASGKRWMLGAQITYDHGFAVGSDQFELLKSTTLEVAARAFTMHRETAFDAFQRVAAEASGFAPDLFLTQEERDLLADFSDGGIG